MHFLVLGFIFIVAPTFLTYCLMQDCPHLWIPLTVTIMWTMVFIYMSNKKEKGEIKNGKNQR